jgi:hypothetical protein
VGWDCREGWYVVSPLYLDGDGDETCITCRGLGHTWKLEGVAIDWSELHADPSLKRWHVENDSRIPDSAIGLGPFADRDQEKAEAAIERIVACIENAKNIPDGTTGMSVVSKDTPAASSGPCIRRNPVKHGIKVVFPIKPSLDVPAGLKYLGFRWSRRQGLWHAGWGPALWCQVHELLTCVEQDW